MSQLALFIAYLVFAFVSHFAVQGVIYALEKHDNEHGKFPAWFQLILFVGLLGTYFYAIWWFCGWVVNSFN